MNSDKEQYIELRLRGAESAFSEVELFHVPNEIWNTAVNRLYYACFYAITALLYHRDIDAKTHSGAKRMFGLHFVKTGIVSEAMGEFYTDLFDMRQNADYEAGVEYEKEDVLPLLPMAKELIENIESIIAKGV